MIYQSFVLDEDSQRKADGTKLKGKGVDAKREEKLINFLKTKYTVLVSNATFAGVHTIVMVGCDLKRAKNIKEDFGKMTGELGLHFVSGAFFTEAS